MRIEKHKSRYYGTKSYTAQTDDWELFLLLPADDYSHAIRLERHIKSMKSRRYIASLKKNPDLVNRLLDRTRQRFTDRL
jgi:putative endonuclease